LRQAVSDVNRAPELLSPDRWGLFLDVDGTLVDLVATPGLVRIDPQLRQVVADVAARLDGALAIVSGRSIAELDWLFAPLRLPTAGVHGLERRDAAGGLHRVTGIFERLAIARLALKEMEADCPGLLLEDKGCALALHFRQVPALEERVRRAATEIAAELGDDFHVQEGSKVLEIKPSGHTKATAIEAFLAEPPFAGRVPVFVGDDMTDCDGFAAVTRHRGVAIAVGDRVTAPWRLEDPQAVRRWLATIVSSAATAR
jgi:trehalose 6-phosphate phosphatase